MEKAYKITSKSLQLMFCAKMCTRPVIYPDFIYFIFYKSPFASKFSWKKRSSHQGKKEVACIVSKPLASWESVNCPKLNMQEVQGLERM